MSFIIQIDTATKNARISLSKAGQLTSEELNEQMKDHASFVQPALKRILKKAGISFEEISAVAVAHGPGSYTGLRVGMASAKGLSFALNKPLITVGSLQILARGVKDTGAAGDNVLICPMIDARRMEVFTALFDSGLTEMQQPEAVVLTTETHANWLLKNEVWFVGDGSEKYSKILEHKNAKFVPEGNNSLAMSELAYQKYEAGEFVDVAYAEPLYLKEFFSPNAL